MTRLEKTLEKDIIALLRHAGFWAIKLWCTSARGLPDRLVLGPNGCVFFIEFKRTKSAAMQVWQFHVKKMLSEFGFTVYVVSDIKQVHEIITARSKQG